MKTNHITLVLCLILALIASTASSLLVVESSDRKPLPLTRTGEVNPPQRAAESASALESERVGSSLKAPGKKSFGQLPLSFEANQGQTDRRVKFISRNSGYNLFLTSDESVLTFQRGNGQGRPDDSGVTSLLSTQSSSFTLRMKLAGASRRSRIAGIDELAGKSNYLTGNDPRKWRRNIPTYGRVRYEAVYPGIDLIYYGHQRQLEYDFIVSTGADVSRIKLDFTGADDIRIDANGDLVLKLDGKEVRQLAPKAYQEIDGVKRSIACRYELQSAHRVHFQLGAYDKTKQLVIDPILNYSTFLGGASYDDANAIAVGSDSQGANAYITGSTMSSDFPTTAGAYQATRSGTQNDVFVAKLNQDGSGLMYSTYIGGTSNDVGYAIAVDGAGQAFVAGATQSSGFPTTPGAYSRTLSGFQNVFVAKLGAAGNVLVFSTLLGGSNAEAASSIAIDSSGTYVGGRTHSPNFPVTAGAYETFCIGNCLYDQGFVTKLDLSGQTLLYSTYVGVSPYTAVEGIAVDSAGDIYAAGGTGLNGVRNGGYLGERGPIGGKDGFVIKLSTTGGFRYGAYVGGSTGDFFTAIAVDAEGSAYVTGYTESVDYPTTPGAFRRHIFGAGEGYNAFVTKLGTDGSLQYSTFLEGDGDDRGKAIAVDLDGNAYVTGETSSPNFPTTDDALQKSYEGGKFDAFATKVNATGTALDFSTYWGGTAEESGHGIALDQANNVYLTGVVFSWDLPTTAGAYWRNIAGSSDAFVLRLGMSEPSFNISGRVTNDLNNPLKGVNVFINGSFSRNVHTDADGNYFIGGLAPGGDFTVSANRGQFVFSPSNAEFPSLQQNETLNFSGPAPLVISGTLKDSAGNPLSRSISLSGSATATVQSDDSGHYAFNDLVQGGNYTVTPSSNYSVFSPPSTSVTALSGDATLNFTELFPPIIWGQINNEYGQGVAATVTLSGDATETKETDWQGRFSFYPARGGNYTVTPSSSYFTFSPVSQSVSNISEDQNFTFTALRPLFIAGRITSEYGSAVSDLEVALTGTASATTTTNYDGRYYFYDLPRAGTYTVTPSATRYTFTPPSQTVSNIQSDQTLDFSGLPPSNIWGTVSGEFGRVEGVTVTIVGGTVNETTVTNSSGAYYSPEVPRGGTYTVTPSHPLYTITPSSQTVTDTVTWQEASFSATRKMYSISGRVTDGSGAPVPAVAINVFGNPWTETDTSGNYSIIMQAGASFLIVPSKSGWTFIQPNYSNSDLRENTTVNFVGTRVAVTISGRVVDSVGAALSGVSVSLAGSQTASSQTDTLGNYAFTALPAGGNYLVTPSLANFAFFPGSQSFASLNADQSADFTGMRILYTLSGRVKEGAAGLVGVTVALSGDKTATAQTDSIGNYSFAGVPAGGNYTVTPSHIHFTFSPANRSFTSLNANKSDEFAATRLTYSVSVHITEGAAGLGGVAVALSGMRDGTTRTAPTNSSGNYIFTGVEAGIDYAVTPSLANFSFSPGAKSFANLSANQSGDFAATRLTYSVSGRINEGAAGLGGVTVTLTGGQTATAQSDSSGNYTFSAVPAGGNYTVTPSLANFSFSPANASFTSLSSNQSADFAGTRLTYTVSGRITEGAAGIDGVTVALSGSQTASSQTDAAGNYTFTGLPAGGSYTVTPSLANFSFSPATRSFTNLAANQSADFAGTRFTYTVNGRVTVGAAGMAGVTVTLSGGQAGTAQTDSAGNYSFANLAAGSNYTVSPSKTHYTFSPPSTSFNSLSSNSSANFSASLLTHSISGRVLDGGGAAMGGVSVSLTGSQTGSGTTDSGGNYAFLSLPAGGNYTITTSKALYSFSPSTQTFNDLGANQTANFTGSLLNFGITGRVTEGGFALAGVTITLSGGLSGTTLTNAAGTYAFSGLPAGGNYNVSASAAYYAFLPLTWTFNGLAANQTADFIAARLTYQVSGAVQNSCGTGIAGVTMTLSRSGVTATTATDATGNYTFAGVQAGFNYSLAPTKTGYTFNPGSVLFSNLNSNQSANFSATPAVADTPFAATADSYVTGGSSANSNFGSLTQLITRLASSNTNTFETYLTFDVGQLCTVSSVKLRMFGKLSSSNPANLKVQAFPVPTTTWTEAGITWNNKPAAGALLATATIVNTTSTWYEWDVTAYVRAEIAAGRNVVSLVLRNQATSSNQVTFNSGEAASNQPQLMVTTP